MREFQIGLAYSRQHLEQLFFYTPILFLSLFNAHSKANEVVDFEDVATRPSVNEPGGDIVSGGFYFDTETNQSHRSNRFPGSQDNGSTHVNFSDYRGLNPVVMSRVDRASFSLFAVDLTEARLRLGSAADRDFVEPASEVMFTGRFVGGGSIEQVFDIGSVWNTYHFGDHWKGLSSVTMKGIGTPFNNSYEIDNIRFQLVPEPITASTLTLAALCVAAGCRGHR